MTDSCYLVPVAVQAQSSAFIWQFLPSVQTDSNRRSYLGDLSFGIQQGWSDGKKIYHNFPQKSTSEDALTWFTGNEKVKLWKLNKRKSVTDHSF